MPLYDILAALFDVVDGATELQTSIKTLRLWMSDEVAVSMTGYHHLSVLTPFSYPLASKLLAISHRFDRKREVFLKLF